MDLEIISLYQGDGVDERLVLKAVADTDIGHYFVVDSTYNKDNTLSNHFRHTFWFPSQIVKKGELIVLYTKKGNNYYRKPTDKQPTGAHFYYWDVNHNVWNDDHDSVTLINACAWDSKQFKDILK
jgi:hypothetical protein